MDRLFSTLNDITVKAETECGKHGEDLLCVYQRQALQNYASLPLPDPREKSWSRLAAREFPEGVYPLAGKPKVDYRAGAIKNDNDFSGRIEIHENAIEIWLSESAAQKGMVLSDLEGAFNKHAHILEMMKTGCTGTGNDKLAAFTAGASQHGFLLYVPENARIDLPLEITGGPQTENSVLPVSGFIVLGEGASLTILSKQYSSNQSAKISVATLNLRYYLGALADLRVLEIQKLDKNAWNFVDEEVRLGRQAKLEYLILDKGSALLRRRLDVVLEESGGSANITGIYTPGSKQDFVYDTQQNHLASNTASDLLFGGVIKGDAYSLWKGNIYVAEGTRGADGFQRNQNLLLDEEAHAESIPGLEIIADDVRCTHAVTLSNVDEEQLFFLQSRGIEKEEAEQLIVNGFLESVTARIGDRFIQERMRAELN